jgi:galactose-1-phosphate uridylyltransferase
VKICVICAFPERCEAEAVCPFEKNWPTEQQIVARENRANKDRLQERAIRSLEDASSPYHAPLGTGHL